MRLKYEDGTYKETQEAIDFEASDGSLSDLLDDERWLCTNSWYKTQRIPHSGPVTPTGFITDRTIRDHALWNPRPSIGSTNMTRITTHPHMAFKLVARACMSERSKLGDVAKETREQHSMTSAKRMTANSNITAVYAGISAVSCLPIIMCRTNQDTSTDDLDENVDLLISWEENGDTDDIIWLENMLIPGNIAYLKSALNNELHGQEKERFLQITKREYRLLEHGLNPAGVAKSLPSNESTARKPAIRRLTHEGQEYDSLHFKMRWPPMAALEFPKEMIDAMERFLSNFPHDNVPLNIALAATIIYMDLADEGWLGEGFTGNPNSLLNVRPPPLGQFVLYFPHMLRFVEIKHLTQFIHPGRFAAGNYIKDGKNDCNIKINSTLIDLKKMKLWYSQIRCRYPQISKNYRFRLIPASMPGTHMVFPHDCTNAEPPSIDLFIICCLNDIRTLGLPSYHPNYNYDDEDGGVFRYVAGPDWLFSKYLRLPTHSIQGPPAADYWRRKSDTDFMALTGEARRIDALFPDVSSNYYTDNKDIEDFVHRYFGDVAYYTQDFDYCEHNSERSREKRSARAKELYRVAAYLQIPVDKLWQCEVTGCPTWEGMETQLQQLSEQDLLNSIINEEPERVAKRPRISEPTLDMTAKTRIQTLIGSAVALSQDWNALTTYLEKDKPTIEEAKRLLSEIHPFIFSAEELHANASDGKVDLEEVLRIAYRAVNLDQQLASIRREKNWTAFSQFGQSIEQAIKDITALRPLEDGLRFALPSIDMLGKSTLIQDQIRIYKEIETLL